MTQLIILINIAVFISQIINPAITYTYAFDSSVWYTYFSCCFLHGNLEHILGNLLFLSFIFPVIEKRYGGLFLFGAYLFTGACGNLLTALFDPTSIGLGASGSIMGVMMLWIFHNLMEGRPLLIIAALMFFMKEGVMSGLTLIFSDGIGHLAHYGSALGAFFLLPIIYFKRK